jgi:hypothetical protein
MTEEQVLAAVPLVYALCGKAQRAAAAAALAAAANRPPPQVDDRALWQEHLYTCLWRLCLDWPTALALPSAKKEATRSAFARWHRQARTRQASSTAFADATSGILREVADGADGAPPPLQALRAAPLARARGAWRAFTENAPYPLRARGKNDIGVGRTQTARGMLAHGLRLRAGHVDAYCVHTPTDRNFADAARLTAQFDTLCAAPDNAETSPRQMLECAILALDPCVPYRVEWRERTRDA